MARAATIAEAEIRSITADWASVLRMADKWGISIDTETGEAVAH